jgi:hypothetical protein
MTDPQSQALDVLVCDWQARPRGAPGIAEIAPSVQGVRRDGAALVVSFDANAARDVEAFVAAEQQCCSTLTWALEPRDGSLVLTIGAAPQQLDVLEQLFRKT